jgi:cupin 2 domain-containing protein
MISGNIFSQIETPINELFEVLFTNNNSKIERIISPHMPAGNDIWYNQSSLEIVFLLKGNAIIEFENNEMVNLRAGDYLKIEPHCKHRIAFSSKFPLCIWLAIHFENSTTHNIDSNFLDI